MAFNSSVVLASGSPRRRELLKNLFENFEILVPNVDETLRPGESLGGAVSRLALEKAQAVAKMRPDSLIIAADTLVGFIEPYQVAIFEKPQTEQHAVEMLRTLSGRTHYVITGFCLMLGEKKIVSAEKTAVTFRDLEEEEIRSYVATGEPMDKAGAYAIQGGASSFVKLIDGSLSNVIGLPMERLTAELERLER